MVQRLNSLIYLPVLGMSGPGDLVSYILLFVETLHQVKSRFTHSLRVLFGSQMCTYKKSKQLNFFTFRFATLVIDEKDNPSLFYSWI